MKIPRSRLALIAAFVAALVFFIVQMNLLPGISPKAGREKGFALLANLLDIIRHDYLEETDPVRTADGAYRGLVNSLDALSCYLDKDLTPKFLADREDTTGPGILIFKHYNDFPQVRGVVADSPADKAGIRIGDVVSAIDGRETLRMSLTEANLNLQGKDETPVRLKIIRGRDTLELPVARARLHPKPASLVRTAEDPAVLVVHRFSPPLAASVRNEVIPLVRSSGTPLVIDLRTCFGGDYEEARAFANLFLRTSSIGSFGKKSGGRKMLAGAAEPAGPDLPLAVWVGPATMGPAELVSGVLQELGRATVIGTETLGLVAKQEFFPLKDGSSVLLTTEVFSLPSGRLLWEDGVHPDAELEGADFSDKAYLKLTTPFPAKR